MARQLFGASDYAGLITKNDLSFYYGYEKTSCDVHGYDNRKDCESCDTEWCFTASRKGKEVWRCSNSTIERCFKDSIKAGEPCENYLLAGIALYLETVNL